MPSEFQAFNALRKADLGVHVIQYSTGRWGFAGSGIPADLSWQARDGGKADPAEIRKGLKFGFGFVKSVKPRSYASKEEAWKAAAEYGISPYSCC